MTFSIITVVFNGENLIEGTIKSVLNQTYKNIEYIIVDGASKDGTMNIVNNYVEKYPIRWISEPDKGLYDAMNKGLKMATGDFVLFLNAGDQLFEPTTLEKMAAQADTNTDILYGEVMLVDDSRRHVGTRSEMSVQKLPEKLTWQNMKRGMVVCHQAFLPKRTLAPQYMPNNLSADIDWVIRCLKQSKNVVNTHLIVSEYLMGGMSKKRHNQSLKDRYVILKEHFGFLPNLINHFFIIIRAFLFKLFNKNGY